MENGTFIDVLPIKKADFHSYVELPGYVVNTKEPQKPRWTAHLLLMPVGKANRSSSPIKSHETNCAAWYKATKFQFLGGNHLPIPFQHVWNHFLRWCTSLSSPTPKKSEHILQRHLSLATSGWMLDLDLAAQPQLPADKWEVQPPYHCRTKSPRSHQQLHLTEQAKKPGQPCIFLWFGLQPIC